MAFQLLIWLKMELRILDNKALGDRIADFLVDGGGGGTLNAGILRNNKYVFDVSRHLFEVLNSGENPTFALVPTTRTTAAHRTILRGGKGLAERATGEIVEIVGLALARLVVGDVGVAADVDQAALLIEDRHRQVAAEAVGVVDVKQR